MKIYSYKNLLRAFSPCVFLFLIIYLIIYGDLSILEIVLLNLGILLIIYNLILNKRFIHCYIYLCDNYMEFLIIKFAHSKDRLFD